ncbi:MAG: hypothetical protein JNL11_07305 [Bdellovibrionaceae bacterium]|nr:hypothetical protein [Pseudobdellovibrionaceae bacterium]
MKILFSTVLFFVLISRVSLAQETVTNLPSSKDSRVQELIAKLDKTQWTGRSGYFLGDGSGWKHPFVNDAFMAFQVLDGKVYYLSSINKTIDALIEKGAQGLCVKSPPREMKFESTADGKAFVATVIVPFLSKDTPPVLGFKQIKLDFALLESGALGISKYDVLKGKARIVATNYLLNKISTPKTVELAARLNECLEKKPWQ